MEDKKIVFGRNPVLEYLRAIDSGSAGELLFSESAHGKAIDEIKTLAREKNIRTSPTGNHMLDKMSGEGAHQGVVLRISYRSLNKDFSLETIAGNNGFIVLLDQITDPHNAGSIIRSAEAFGASAVIMPKANSSGITPIVEKSAAGATAHIHIEIVSNAAQFLDQAKKKGFWILGSSDHGNISLKKIKEIRPAVLIIGSEGKGMRRLTEEKCDYVARIPLTGQVSSLNASVAAGIFLYELAGK